MGGVLPRGHFLRHLMWTSHFLYFLERNRECQAPFTDVSNVSAIHLLSKPPLIPSPTLPHRLLPRDCSRLHRHYLVFFYCWLQQAMCVYLSSVSTWIVAPRTAFMSHGSPTHLRIRTNSLSSSNLSFCHLPATWEHCWCIHGDERLCASATCCWTADMTGTGDDKWDWPVLALRLSNDGTTILFSPTAEAPWR